MVRSKARQVIEIAAHGDRTSERAKGRLLALERLVSAIEDELSDETLSDDQKLQNIGERVAAVMDGR